MIKISGYLALENFLYCRDQGVDIKQLQLFLNWDKLSCVLYVEYYYQYLRMSSPHISVLTIVYR